ncbi:MAG: tetratricopeptide repeat protein [Hyphomicrobiales bacterium]|nr:tetratricopeptide repeat protein [Hyphomicrobiales bacterium]MCP5370386.1 tetratricopeptide repeat protein [Hyphomicrobiales bacterium]
MTAVATLKSRLRALAARPDGDLDVGATALVLAAMERPGATMDSYLRHLERLSGAVADYALDPAGADLDLRAEALRHVIVRRYGYLGGSDTGDEPEAENLYNLIDGRMGSAPLLAVLYLKVAADLGWPARAIDFPARPLVRLDHGGGRVLLDPFGGGRPLGASDLRELLKAAQGLDAEMTPDHYREMDGRDLLARIQNRVKVRYLRGARLEDALRVLDTMVTLCPDRPVFWRELGLLQARLDRTRDAIAALEHYLRLCPADSARYRTTVLLQELRGKLN